LGRIGPKSPNLSRVRGSSAVPVSDVGGAVHVELPKDVSGWLAPHSLVCSCRHLVFLAFHDWCRHPERIARHSLKVAVVAGRAIRGGKRHGAAGCH
jgi:hypothetical protein